MPIWLRKFTFVEIKTHFESQNKSSEDNTQKGSSILVDKDGKVNTPSFLEASKQYKGKTGYK